MKSHPDGVVIIYGLLFQILTEQLHHSPSITWAMASAQDRTFLIGHYRGWALDTLPSMDYALLRNTGPKAEAGHAGWPWSFLDCGLVFLAWFTYSVPWAVALFHWLIFCHVYPFLPPSAQLKIKVGTSAPGQRSRRRGRSASHPRWLGQPGGLWRP